MQQKLKRLYYLDNLRVITMMTVFIFHIAHIFDPLPFYVNNAEKSSVLFGFVVFANFWMMPLFFLIAGASATIAMQRRTTKAFLVERLKRLVIPYLFGIVVLIPIQDYLSYIRGPVFTGSIWNLRLNAITPGFFGTIGNHLWFLAFLFIYSLIVTGALWMRSRVRRRPISFLFHKLLSLRGGTLILMIMIASISAVCKLLWPHYTSWGDFVFWFLVFAAGMVIFSNRGHIEIVKKDTWLYVISLLVSAGGLTALFLKGGMVLYSDPEIAILDYMFQFVMICVSFSMIFLFLSLGQHFLDRSNRVWAVGSRIIMPFYMFHQTLLVVIGFFVVEWNLEIPVKFLIITGATIASYMIIHFMLIKPFKPVQFLLGAKLS